MATANGTQVGHWLLALDARTVHEGQAVVGELVRRTAQVAEELDALVTRLAWCPDEDLYDLLHTAHLRADDALDRLLDVRRRLDS
jgi:hypothetical protein